jgi:hypothetical protein
MSEIIPTEILISILEDPVFSNRLLTSVGSYQRGQGVLVRKKLSTGVRY